MRRAKAALSVVLGLSLIAAVLYLLYLGVAVFARFLASLDSTLAASLVAASATVVVSVLSVLLAKWVERRNQVSHHLREQKIPPYQGLIRFAFDVLYAERLGKGTGESEKVKTFAEMTPQLITWGDQSVIASWARFRRMTTDPNAKKDTARVAIALENVYRAIRKDLGHKDDALKRGDILALFVNEVDKLLAGTSREV